MAQTPDARGYAPGKAQADEVIVATAAGAIAAAKIMPLKVVDAQSL
jgi:hypothetical protein